MTTVKNISQANQGIHTNMGVEWLEPGQSKNLNLNKDHVERAKELAKAKLIELDGITVENDDPGEFVDPAKPVYKTKHKSGGKYSVFNGDDEVKQDLTKEEADTFNGLDDEGKAAFLTA